MASSMVVRAIVCCISDEEDKINNNRIKLSFENHACHDQQSSPMIVDWWEMRFY
jgi:hypothetical protein